MLSPLYGQLSPLRIPTKSRALQDSDAIAYIAAVEAADAQTLEDAVKFAYEDFILGCKADGIWSAIKASCILAGARTLSGALVPLVGTAPTNFNFVSGDYNRKTGLLGNGSTKYLGSNRNNSSDGKDNFHLSVYISQASSNSKFLMGAGANATQGQSLFAVLSSKIQSRLRSTTLAAATSATTTGFISASRSTASNFNLRVGSTNQSFSIASQSPFSGEILIFRTNQSTVTSDGRKTFYSIGENIDLAALDTRVSTLMTAIAAAIP